MHPSMEGFAYHFVIRFFPKIMEMIWKGVTFRINNSNTPLIACFLVSFLSQPPSHPLTKQSIRFNMMEIPIIQLTSKQKNVTYSH